MTETYVRRLRLPVAAETAFAWHARPGALERLVPPWSGVAVLERTGGIEDGARTVLRMPLGPLSVRWVAEHVDYQPGRSFRDVQVRGPFRQWDHVHTVEPLGPRDCELEDRITYALPPTPLAGGFASTLVGRQLERTFAYRHRTTSGDLRLHALRSRRALTVALTEPDNFVGRALSALLSTGGHRVVRLVRGGAAREDEIAWDLHAGVTDPGLDDVDAVVCLRADGIAARRWSIARKARLLRDAVETSRLFADASARSRRRPLTLVTLSSVGVYGSQGYQRVDDDAPAGAGFWSEVCRQSEAAAEVARAAGVRVVHLRAGWVLSSAGGPLSRAARAFRLGLGPLLGDGRNFVAWVSLDDLIGAILWAITGDELDGPVNVVTPQAVTQRELATTLARVLERTPGPTVPRRMVSVVLGQMGRELLLASTRAEPTKLTRVGYPFRDPRLEPALRHTLGVWPLGEDSLP